MKSKWLVLLLLRWLWVLLPQSGYIHPDEFFQSVEVVSGDVLDIEVHKTWEFKPTQPIRSTLMPCLLYWPAFVLLKVLTEIGCLTSGSIVSTSTIVIAPRVVISILGTIVDLLVLKTLKFYKGFDISSGMLMYSTSYVALVYYTRTLSNTIEAFLFILFVYSIQSDIHHFKKHDNRSTKSNTTNNPMEKNMNKYVRFPQICYISFCLVAGTFNRPTFLIFAYAPYFHWLYNGYLPYNLTELLDWMKVKVVFAKIQCTLIVAAIPTVIFITWDCLYYDAADVIVTPFNFIEYNSKGENLAEHGTHSRLTHLFVNVPLLFGPVAVCLFFDLFTYVVTKGHMTEKRTSVVNPVDTKFWIHSFAFPILLLSVFPHQEPRFLIPMLLPLVILYSHLIFGCKSLKLFKILWILFNIIAGLFYGCFHQGQLINAMEHMKHHTFSSNVPSNYVIFSHTYMPPKHFFNIKAEENLASSYKYLFPSIDLKTMFNDSWTYMPSSKLKINDLQGKPWSNVETAIYNVKGSTKWNRNNKVFVIIPSTFDLTICSNSANKYKYKFVKQFVGHITMEDLPSKDDFYQFKQSGFQMTFCDLKQENDVMMYGLLRSLFSLNIYEVFDKTRNLSF